MALPLLATFSLLVFAMPGNCEEKQEAVLTRVKAQIEAQFHECMETVARLTDTTLAVPYLATMNAMCALQEMSDERCVPTLTRLLERNARVLLERENGGIVPGSAPPLFMFKRVAINIIKEFGELEYVPLLDKVRSGDPSRKVRTRADRAIQQLKTIAVAKQDTLTSLVEKLMGDPLDAETSTSVLAELRTIDRRLAVTMLDEYTKKAHPLSIRKRAISILGGMGSYQALVPLAKLLWDVDEDIRIEAATALGYTGYEAALPALEHSLNDPSEKVKKTAKRAIESIEGRNRRGGRRLP